MQPLALVQVWAIISADDGTKKGPTTVTCGRHGTLQYLVRIGEGPSYLVSFSRAAGYVVGHLVRVDDLEFVGGVVFSLIFITSAALTAKSEPSHYSLLASGNIRNRCRSS